MNWKHFIEQLRPKDKDFQFDFNDPSAFLQIEQLKAEFNLAELPDQLVELYQQTNGINETLRGEPIGTLVWPIERVIENNHEYRTLPSFPELYMSFDQLLFFADAGNGDLFAFVTLGGRFDRLDVFVWDHETDSRTWVAPDLKTFLEWWVNGKLKI